MKFIFYFVLIFSLLGAAGVQAEENRKLTLVTPTPEQNEQKIALVIGNANYESSPLKNPVNDARAISAKLKELGFEIIAYENLRHKQLGEVSRTFRSRAPLKGELCQEDVSKFDEARDKISRIKLAECVGMVRSQTDTRYASGH